ncbi:hypothetical protein [Ensifer sp. 4252]|uniref:hypothetical protein n=1 Tax=Ensifer sp. 4252 TaxID=3373915 RepID=UPI003D1A56A9
MLLCYRTSGTNTPSSISPMKGNGEVKKLAIGALSLATAFSSVAPAQALKAGISDVETVHYYHRRWYRGGDDYRWGGRSAPSSAGR